VERRGAARTGEAGEADRKVDGSGKVSPGNNMSRQMTTKAKKAKPDDTRTGAAVKEPTRKEIIRAAILATCDERGETTPDRVFAAAKDPSSPLHDEFIWDGETAVRELGLETAARLIRLIKVEIVVDSVKIAAPYYVSDPRDNEERNYVRLQDVKRSDDMAKAVMLDELSRIESALNRARAISGFLEMTNEFETMLSSVVSIRARIGAK
jgi:hypothetical protein